MFTKIQINTKSTNSTIITASSLPTNHYLCNKLPTNHYLHNKPAINLQHIKRKSRIKHTYCNTKSTITNGSSLPTILTSSRHSTPDTRRPIKCNKKYGVGWERGGEGGGEGVGVGAGRGGERLQQEGVGKRQKNMMRGKGDPRKRSGQGQGGGRGRDDRKKKKILGSFFFKHFTYIEITKVTFFSFLMLHQNTSFESSSLEFFIFLLNRSKITQPNTPVKWIYPI